jgi:hypothetical protein
MCQSLLAIELLYKNITETSAWLHLSRHHYFVCYMKSGLKAMRCHCKRSPARYGFHRKSDITGCHDVILNVQCRKGFQKL